MTNAYTPFKARDCRMCGARLLTGRSDGLGWLMDSTPIPEADGLVLLRYGVMPLILDVHISGLIPQMWHPASLPLGQPGRFLVAPHVCGSPHALASIKEKR